MVLSVYMRISLSRSSHRTVDGGINCVLGKWFIYEHATTAAITTPQQQQQQQTTTRCCCYLISIQAVAKAIWRAFMFLFRIASWIIIFNRLAFRCIGMRSGCCCFVGIVFLCTIICQRRFSTVLHKLWMHERRTACVVCTLRMIFSSLV